MELSRGIGLRLIWIFWPSFIVGGLAEMVFFSLFDPLELPFADLPLGDATLGENRTAVYTIGFFIFWAFAAASSAFTCFLQRPASDINRYCPLEPVERPAGCPKRDDPNAECCD